MAVFSLPIFFDFGQSYDKICILDSFTFSWRIFHDAVIESFKSFV